MEIYFTFHPTEQGGVTDQLIQFSAWYKLGRSLGYKYIHPSMISNRSSSKIYNFLGFYAIWTNQEIFSQPACSVIVLSLSSRDIKLLHVWGLKRLQLYIKRNIKKATSKLKSNTVLVAFRLENIGDRAIFRVIEKSVTSMPDNINLRQSYFDHRALEPHNSLFKSNGIKVLVHIRQGDATTVETPWGTYLSVFSSSVAEFPDREASLPAYATWDQMRAIRSLKSYLDPLDYYRFIKLFTSKIHNKKYSIVVSSDGYAKTFSMIKKSSAKLQLTDYQLLQLSQLEETFERSKFQKLNQLQNIQMILGENDENLFDLIHSALTSDVIITSAQQMMMVKLLQLYGSEINPPLFIMLHNSLVKPVDIQSRLGNKVKKVIYVNIDDLEKSCIKCDYECF